MKNNFVIKEITKEMALDMIQRYHYSNTLPKLNRHYVGFYLEDELVGVITLGWGTRPLHTIKKIFPSLSTEDYFEIGRMCMTEEMPRNSESQMISKLIKWLKQKEPNVKVLFTWADGIMGKVGYVYQSCSFLYGGYSLTDIYIKDGIKIHPRQTKQFFSTQKDDKRVTVRPTIEQMKEKGVEHIRGRQFKYLKFLCDKKTKKKLLEDCLITLNYEYPKEKDLYWEKQVNKGKYTKCDKPFYRTDFNTNTKNNINLDETQDCQINIYDFL